jgi:hypothetical protein
LKIDYIALKNRCNIYKEELIQKALHPSRLDRYFNQGFSIDEVLDFF